MAKGALAKKPQELEQVVGIKIGQLRESPFNHREDFGDLEEMAASMRPPAGRIYQALIVRAIDDKKTPFEIVFGHRRYRAAKVAKLDEVPAVVRVLTDAEVKKAQLVENLQRKDVNAMEEAEGFNQLVREGQSPDDIGDLIGKSKAHVYGRLKLLALRPAARKALLEDRISASLALLIARIPSPERMDKATQEVLTGGQRSEETGWKDTPMSVRQAFEHIQSHYMLRLLGAPFSQTDVELYPEAGSCKDCPKRTGNQRHLFPDVKSADVCTDPDCFKEKVKRNSKHQLKLAEEKGLNVTKGGAAVFRKEFVEAGKPQTYAIQNSAEYVDPRDHVPGEDKSWEKMLGRKAPEVKLVQDPAGKIHKLYLREEAVEGLRKTGAKKAVQTLKRIESVNEQRHSSPEERKAEQLRYERREAIEDLTTSIQVSMLKEKLAGPDCLRLALFGHMMERQRGQPKEIWTEISALAPADVERTLVDQLCDTLRHRWLDNARKVVAGELGVDLGAADAEARAMVDTTLEEEKVAQDEEANRCKDPDCPNPKKGDGYLYCEDHDAARGRPPAQVCEVPGCGGEISNAGFCAQHDANLSAAEKKSIKNRNDRLHAEGKTPDGKKARKPRKASAEATDPAPVETTTSGPEGEPAAAEDGAFPDAGEAAPAGGEQPAE